MTTNRAMPRTPRVRPATAPCAQPEDEPMRGPIAPTAMSVADIAAALGLSRSSVYNAIRRGEIPATRIGRRWVVAATSVQAILRAQRERRDPRE